MLIPENTPNHNQSLCPRHDRYVRRSSPRVANVSSIPSAEIRLFCDWFKTLVTVKRTGGQVSVEPSNLPVILMKVHSRFEAFQHRHRLTIKATRYSQNEKSLEAIAHEAHKGFCEMRKSLKGLVGRFTKAVRDCFRVDVSQQAGIYQGHADITEKPLRPLLDGEEDDVVSRAR
ncbi:uncharacterized protein BXZ73DRAFT_108582 [Epithele typhae]|uniref:uncharacterized protein n=1 Tax=Epithele typhae TaxID=378194 RepID=UPI0020089D59|nr:uncharacterized protein BXZ73DRAFT_108582 [Epithele typhae]KAH9910723.1 hypothetical protein BXZ73DRAFT_108582 [Epithele typhae]